MNALVLGASGLVGNEVVELLVEDVRFKEVHLLSRSERIKTDPRKEGVGNAKNWVINFDTIQSLPSLPKIDVLFVAFGTTIKTAGTQDAQWTIDVDYPSKIISLAKESGVSTLVLVSAMGASEQSRFFYSRMKAALEQKAEELEFSQLVIVRPSVLNGARKEKRTGERISIIVGNILGLTGLINKWRPVKVKDVAKCMIESVFVLPSGKHLIESDRIGYFAERYTM